MEVPTPHIIFNLLLGLVCIAGITTALALILSKNTRNFGISLVLVFIPVSISQNITQGYSDFARAPYWWVFLIVAGIGLLIAIWQYSKVSRFSLFNKAFWWQWKRAFWMLFGIMLIASMVNSLFT